MAGDEGVVLRMVGEERLPHRDARAVRDDLQAGDELVDVLHPLLGGIDRRADGHEAGRGVGEYGVRVVQPQRALERKAQPL